MSDDNNNVYAYGIIEQEDLERPVDGVCGADRVYTVDYRGLSAVVSDIDTTDPDRNDESVQAHNDVLREVMVANDGRTVVPMGYGMAFKNSRTLKGVMRGARRAFRKALNDIENTVELGVKVLAPGEEYDQSGEVRSDIESRLSAVSVDDTDDELFSDRLILNKSYLVDHDDRDAFDETIDDIQADYGEDCKIHYTGPFAPYSFVDIRVGAEQQGAR